MPVFFPGFSLIRVSQLWSVEFELVFDDCRGVLYFRLSTRDACLSILCGIDVSPVDDAVAAGCQLHRSSFGIGTCETSETMVRGIVIGVERHYIHHVPVVVEERVRDIFFDEILGHLIFIEAHLDVQLLEYLVHGGTAELHGIHAVCPLHLEDTMAEAVGEGARVAGRDVAACLGHPLLRYVVGNVECGVLNANDIVQRLVGEGQYAGIELVGTTDETVLVGVGSAHSALVLRNKRIVLHGKDTTGERGHQQENQPHMVREVSIAFHSSGQNYSIFNIKGLDGGALVSPS